MAIKEAAKPRTRDKIVSVVPGQAWGKDPAFSIAQAAVAVGVSRKAMYDYVTARRIGHHRLGGQLFIRQSDIDAFLAAGRVKAAV